MNLEVARKVADTVLYEGYMLYPYRPSAIKNQQRWSFGILYPPGYAEVLSGTERCAMHSECLLESGGSAALRIQLRFLHLLSRQVAKFVGGRSGENRFAPVESLLVDDRWVESWEEAVEREVEFELPSLSALPRQPPFRFAGSCTTELLRDESGKLAGTICRTQYEIAGTISVVCEEIRAGVVKLIIEVANTSELAKGDTVRGNATDNIASGLANDEVARDVADDSTSELLAAAAANIDIVLPELQPRIRDAALLRSLLSAHNIVTVKGGSFVSLLEPPDELLAAVAGCRNIGNFPVLVGAAPERDMLLCSPIILYDYPQIAPESATSFCDGTEMDEMLTLRVMTLTDKEKDEMRDADEFARNLLQRTEENAREQLAKTHGTIRGLRLVGGDKP